MNLLEILRGCNGFVQVLIIAVLFYAACFPILLASTLMRFRKYRSTDVFLRGWLNMTMEECRKFVSLSFATFWLSLLVILVPTGVVIAIINGVFLKFGSKFFIIGWLIVILGLSFMIAIFYGLR